MYQPLWIQLRDALPSEISKSFLVSQDKKAWAKYYLHELQLKPLSEYKMLYDLVEDMDMILLLKQYINLPEGQE